MSAKASALGILSWDIYLDHYYQFLRGWSSGRAGNDQLLLN